MAAIRIVNIIVGLSAVLALAPGCAVTASASPPDSLVKAFYAAENKIGFRFLDSDTGANHLSAYAWGYKYFLDAELMAYNVTKDTALLSHFVHLADVILAHRDDYVGQSDYKGVIGPGWSTERRWSLKLGKMLNWVEPMRDLGEDANIVYPYLRFCKIVLADSAHLSKFVGKAKHYLDEAQKVIDFHIADEWNSGWQRFIFPKGSPIWCDGLNVPNNYEAMIGSDLLILYELKRTPAYLNIVTVMAQHMRESLIAVDGDEDVWRYWSGKSETGWSASENLSLHSPSHDPQVFLEDISHGGVDLSFMEDCYENHLAFNQTDMQHIANAFQKIVNRKTYFAHDLNGKGGDPNDWKYYNIALNGWLRLCQFDKSIYWAYYSIYFSKLNAPVDLGRLFLLASLMENWPG